MCNAQRKKRQNWNKTDSYEDYMTEKKVKKTKENKEGKTDWENNLKTQKTVGGTKTKSQNNG